MSMTPRLEPVYIQTCEHFIRRITTGPVTDGFDTFTHRSLARAYNTRPYVYLN